jgi:glutathione S-transferase
VLATLELMRYDLARHPNLAAWLEASLARPAAQAARAMRQAGKRVPGR